MASVPPPPGTGMPDHNRGPEILAVCGSLTATSFVFVVMRFYVRVRMTKNTSWDDWFCLSAWIVQFVELMFMIPEVRLGGGRHAAYIDPPSDITKGLKMNFVTQPMFVLAVTLIKISIGFFLLRLATSPIYARIIKFNMAVTAAGCVAYIFVLFLQCRPLPFTWGEGEGKCVPSSHVQFAAYFVSVIQILTDLVFALLPIPMLYRLHVNLRIKLAICGILSLGLFATSAACVKVYFLTKFGRQGDFLWDSTDLTIWTSVEVCIAIIAACCTCLKPLFKDLFRGSSFGNTYQLNSRNGYIQQGSKKNTIHGRSADRSVRQFGRNGGARTVMSVPRNDQLDAVSISEASFLPQRDPEDIEGIRKTFQVSVHSDKAYSATDVEDRV